MTRFFLGCHQPAWLRFADVPLFVSRRRLERYRQLPRALSSWALDSGGFTELTLHGGWQLPAASYVAQVRRYQQEIGQLEFAAPQDWMCEAAQLRKTGRSIAEHQSLTVGNYLRLLDLAPDLPWLPVLQGWSLADYYRCLELYARAGIDLTRAALVGLGSVCRRQATKEASAIVAGLALAGVRRIHGFGFKLLGLRRQLPGLSSADSMAWSFDARRSPPLPGCGDKHINCANCWTFARQWYGRIGGQPCLQTS